MTDQIPADKVRKIVNDMRRHADHDAVRGREEEYVGQFADLLEALLPTPPRPTLADMTMEERAACQWMQADVENHSRRYVIAALYDNDADVALIGPDWEFDWIEPECVTPRPDLPRMEWPGNKKAQDVTPAKVGDVIESADDPRLSALPVGSMLIDRDGGVFDVTKTDTGEWDGPGYEPAQGTGTKWGPWTVRRIGLEDGQ